MLSLLGVALGLPANGSGRMPALVAAGPLDGSTEAQSAPETEETDGATLSSADDDDTVEAAEDQSATGFPIISPPSSGTRRPTGPREPSGLVDRVTAPAALVRPVMVSAAVAYAGRNAPLVFPEAALPWRFWVERDVASRFGSSTVVDAVRQWDGIPGSRWATAHAGILEERTPAAVADGRSVVFSQADCPAGVGGFAYWQTATSTADARYGDAAVWITEVDIGICPAVQTPGALRQVIAHEVGHALGLEHMCDPGQPCWKPEMGQGPHGCRVMYAASSSCAKSIGGAEQLAAVHQYPTLRRLSGPSRVETAARASFAAYQAREAGYVVLARGDGTAHGPLAAAALSGVLEAPMLLGTPSGGTCLDGAAAEELARVAAEPGRVVLVGEWPQTCESALATWNLAVERVGVGTDAIGLGVAVAQRIAGSGRMGSSAFIVSSRADGSGHVPDGVAAGAAAGAVGAPVLYTNPDALAPTVAAWLRTQSRIRRVYVMGGAAAVGEGVVADLRALGIDVVRVAGPTRVQTALALASRTELFPVGGSVVIAAASSWADAVTGSSTGARLGAPVLVSPSQPDGGIESWLAARRPSKGYLVGGGAALPYELQWRYARHIK